MFSVRLSLIRFIRQLSYVRLMYPRQLALNLRQIWLIEPPIFNFLLIALCGIDLYPSPVCSMIDKSDVDK